MYEQMKKDLLEALKIRLPDSFKIITFTVMKGNQEKEAFLITEEDTGASPTFYFTDYFNDYCSNTPIEQIVSQIIGTYYYTMQQTQISVDDFKDFESQKDKITFKVINTKLNQKILNEIPNIQFFDLSIIFYCILDINEESCLSYLITNNTMDLWGISKTELFKIAYDNLQQLLPLQIIPFTQIVNNEETICLNVKYTVAALPKDSFYVVTNIFHNNGFANIFTPDLMSTFADKFGDFYILPCSIDEAIFIPVTMMSLEEVRDYIKRMNNSDIEPETLLGSSVYRYNKESGKFDVYVN